MVMDLGYELSCYLLSLHGLIFSCVFRIIVMFFDGSPTAVWTKRTQSLIGGATLKSRDTIAKH